MNRRVLYSKNGDIRDFSSAMDEYTGPKKDFPYIEGEDFLFIGSRLPFNHTYFKLDRVNELTSTNAHVTYWDGTTWREFVETTDETNGFNNSGFITFTPNRDHPWMMSNTNANGQKVDGLESVTIYDLFWLRLDFNQSFVGPAIPDTDPEEYEAVSIQWIGNLFSNDFDLAGLYPDFARQNVMTGFKAGKTSWEEQAVIAGKILIDDLIDRAVIDDGAQILNRSDYTIAAVHKLAELICASFGDDYLDDRKSAHTEYKARMNRRIQRVDVNKNGGEDVVERGNTTGWISR